MAAPVKVAKQQTAPELSETFRTLPPEPTPTRAGTFQNPPEPSRTVSLSDFVSEPSETFRNRPFGTFRNLPPDPTPAYTGTLRNLPELATGTLRNLPEPSSGTCSCHPHRHTPELIWAEDPISLRCWGIKKCGVLNFQQSCCLFAKLCPIKLFQSLIQQRGTMHQGCMVAGYLQQGRHTMLVSRIKLGYSSERWTAWRLGQDEHTAQLLESFWNTTYADMKRRPVTAKKYGKTRCVHRLWMKPELLSQK